MRRKTEGTHATFEPTAAYHFDSNGRLNVLLPCCQNLEHHNLISSAAHPASRGDVSWGKRMDCMNEGAAYCKIIAVVRKV